jgi:hypothetical protein
VSHDKGESVLELKEVELTVRISQGDERQSLEVVREEEKSYVGN